MIKRIILSTVFLVLCILWIEQPWATSSAATTSVTVHFRTTTTNSSAHHRATIPKESPPLQTHEDDTIIELIPVNRRHAVGGIFDNVFDDERDAIRDRWESTQSFFQRIADKLHDLNNHPDPAAKGWLFVIVVALIIGFLGFFACLGAGCYHCCARQCCPYRGTNRVNIYDQSRYQEFVRIAFRIWLQENQDRLDLKARLEREAKVRKDRLDLERQDQEETTVCTTACESTTIGLDG